MDVSSRSLPVEERQRVPDAAVLLHNSPQRVEAGQAQVLHQAHHRRALAQVYHLHKHVSRKENGIGNNNSTGLPESILKASRKTKGL